MAAVGLTVAFLAIGLGGPWRGEFLAPGPLCHSHARLLGDLQGTDRCAACHDAATSSSSQWLASVFSSHALGPVQSEHCLKCHDSTFSGTSPLAAHSVPSETLAQVTQRRSLKIGHRPWLERWVAWPAPPSQHESLACATCHREHHGELDLTTMTDRQCQSCHVEQYHSFELDHPQFRQWPKVMPRHVAFDHAAHESKHFPAKNQSYRCDSCHQSDVTRRVQTLRPFAEACASCHAEGISASTLDGMALLSLPRLDVAALRAAGLNPGDWPEDASDAFDGTFAEPLLALLSGDPQAREAIEQLEDLDLAWLATDDPENLQAVTELAWSVKRLLHELATGNRPALTARLAEAGLGQPETRQDFLESLPYAQLEEAIAVWFPDLEFELAQQTPRQEPTIAPPSASLASPSLSHSANHSANHSVNHSANRGLNSNDQASAITDLPSSEAVPDDEPDLVAIFSAAMSELGGDRQILAENPLRDWKSGRRSDAAATAVLPDSSAETPARVDDPMTVAPIPSASDIFPESIRDDGSPPQSESSETTASPSAPLAPAIPSPASGTLLAENPLRHLRNTFRSSAPEFPPSAPPANTTEDSTPPRPNTNPLSENSPSENPLAGSPSADGMGVERLAQEQRPSESLPTPAASESEVAPSPRKPDDSQADPDAIPSSSDDSVLPWRHEPVQRIGWVRDDRQFRLSYYPQGHADPVLRIWLELLQSSSAVSLESTQELAVAMSQLATGNHAWVTTPPKIHEPHEAVSDLPANRSATPVATWSKQLLGPAGIGGCARCHLPQDQNSRDRIAWTGFHRDVSRGEFTAFSHAPHLLTLDSQVCQSCHQLNSASETAMQMVEHGADSHRRSDFRSLSVKDCATCHQAGQASQACSTCHDYHVGTLRLHP